MIITEIESFLAVAGDWEEFSSVQRAGDLRQEVAYKSGKQWQSKDWSRRKVDGKEAYLAQ